MSSRLRILPVTQEQAFAFIAAWHRHHEPPPGHKFSLGVAEGDLLVGVATVGRPVAKAFDDKQTVEVTRVATDGTRHACSALYGACWRVAKAMGYRRALTYTQDGESGASLKAAGWVNAAQRAARRGWDTPSRRRDDARYQSVSRLLWVVESGAVTSVPSQVSRPKSLTTNPTLFDLEVAS